MSQFSEDITETDTLKDSRDVINRRDEANKSNFSGTTFPTTDLKIGMKCYREDLAKEYTLQQTTPSVVWSQVPLGVPVSVSDGGSGAENASDARDNLGLGGCAVEDTLPVSKGGTGGGTQADARDGIGVALDVTESILPVTSGGTGQGTLAEFRQLLNIPYGGVVEGNYDIAPVTVGGTGSNTASGARNNLGLGTASQKNVGAGSGDIPVLDSQGKIPASMSPFPTGSALFTRTMTSTVDGSWNVPSGINMIRAICRGGGGGGAWEGEPTSGWGLGGNIATSQIFYVDPGQTVYWTIGAGGIYYGGQDGRPGGSTTFFSPSGASFYATGGAGGEMFAGPSVATIGGYLGGGEYYDNAGPWLESKGNILTAYGLGGRGGRVGVINPLYGNPGAIAIVY